MLRLRIGALQVLTIACGGLDVGGAIHMNGIVWFVCLRQYDERGRNDLRRVREVHEKSMRIKECSAMRPI